VISLSGYQAIAKIYESAKSLVYRGKRTLDNQAVILKLLKQDYPTPAELTRYKQEYEITNSLNLEGVIRAYDLQKYQNTLVIILEDFGGESLKHLMPEKLKILEVLNLAIKITESLGQIHASNVIHKDINPANIIFNPATGQLKIIDFGISTVWTRENPTLKNPQVLEGTLAYISPEQTGRMNRSLDYRTDFYSLGVTFYELLTQQRPFNSTDPMELVHSHLAKQPPLPHVVNAEIPVALSKIVLKLLAKTAEERYQSAWGLKADLEECLNQLRTIGTVSEFILGRRDISDKFQIPQKLYGRDAEINTLLRVFEQVSQGKTEMMLVSGYSGIGKSALVQEIYKPITRARGYFLSGKFDQFQRNIPYSAVVKAFQSLIKQLLTESEIQLQQWQAKLLAALGTNGQVIIDVIPEVELIVGKQPPVAELGSAESQNRFNLVFQNFIRVFCQPEHPLVIFLDDLQWVDSATLKLIELMMMDSETHYLLLIGAYRDNEVSPSHPLIMTLDALHREGAIINEINLTPLANESITQLIAETLHSDAESVKTLVSLIVRKNGRKSFFCESIYQNSLSRKTLNV
jgi:serine/threonine protein kinase